MIRDLIFIVLSGFLQFMEGCRLRRCTVVCVPMGRCVFVCVHKYKCETSSKRVSTNRNMQQQSRGSKEKDFTCSPAFPAFHSSEQRQFQLCSSTLPQLRSPVSLLTSGFAGNPAHGPAGELPILLRYLEAERTGYISQLILKRL